MLRVFTNYFSNVPFPITFLEGKDELSVMADIFIPDELRTVHTFTPALRRQRQRSRIEGQPG